jgi:hypothetical protein
MFSRPFIVDHYCLSIYCWPLLFILLLSTIIVYPFIVDHYCLTCDKSVQWVEKSISQISMSELCTILFLKCRILSMSSVSFKCPGNVCLFIFYCFIEKLRSSCIIISGGQVVVVSTDFDFTLLYKLIRNLLTERINNKKINNNGRQ